MQQFRKSSICSPPLDTAASSVGLGRCSNSESRRFARRRLTRRLEWDLTDPIVIEAQWREGTSSSDPVKFELQSVRFGEKLEK
jgi:hypothetical protein